MKSEAASQNRGSVAWGGQEALACSPFYVLAFHGCLLPQSRGLREIVANDLALARAGGGGVLCFWACKYARRCWPEYSVGPFLYKHEQLVAQPEGRAPLHFHALVFSTGWAYS
jgi:hypothetical protein